MTQSRKLFQRAASKIPGGVNSPVRAWKAVGGTPLFISRGQGSYIFDAEGRRYIDFVGSWGPLILGHAHPEIVQVVRQRATSGFTFGAPTMFETELAETVEKLVPSIEKLRLVSSGTEATMSAIRLARAYTGRTKIVKFDGCYHGHSDGLLVRAGSGVATLGLADSAGVPAGFARETLISKYNDLKLLEKIFDRHRKNIAAVIIEPICGNMGVIEPEPGFLSAVREITQKSDSLLIFDEVITGFRVALGGAQEIFRVNPDLTCLGKILGGGLPLAGFGGRSEIMNLLAPVGPVYQAGTLSGNPLAVSAGIATLKLLRGRRVYDELEAKGGQLEEGLTDVLKKRQIRATINRVGSMMTLFFGVDRVTNPDDSRKCDQKQFGRFFHGMLKRGIYLPPSPFEAMFVSLAHSSADLETTIDAFDQWAKSQRSVDRQRPSC
jgi:glutamate-1-semialdehyde 2,1-aminomutase